MVRIIIEIEDLPEGTDTNLEDDLPAVDAKDKTSAWQVAVLTGKMIQAAQIMAPPIRKHQAV